MLKKGSILTLSNGNKYVVVYTTLYNKQEYCYIINKDDDNDSMICRLLPNFNIENVTDKETINQFLKIFVEEFNDKKK